jgi:hypothetical protein
VNTTPKPSATKKSNGELVGLLLLLWSTGALVAAAVGPVDVEDGAAMTAHAIWRIGN